MDVESSQPRPAHTTLWIACVLLTFLNVTLIVALGVLLSSGANTLAGPAASLLVAQGALGSQDVTASVKDDSLQERQCLAQQLDRAEIAYKRNRQRRSVLMGTDEEQLIPLQGEALTTFTSVRGTTWADWFLREYLLIPRYPCLEEERVGMWGEGGKWVCFQSLRKAPEELVIYSIGSRDDTTFEEGMWELLKAKSHTFDPFVDENLKSKLDQRPYLEFHNYGLSTDNSTTVVDLSNHKEGPGKNIHTIMAELGHKFVDVFKIDCEGCEGAFADQLAKTTSREAPLFGQILMEVHKFKNLDMGSHLMKDIHDLGFRLFHMEPNVFCDDCFEVAFIHESLCNIQSLSNGPFNKKLNP